MRPILSALVCGLLALPMSASAAVHRASAHLDRAPQARSVKHGRSHGKHHKHGRRTRTGGRTGRG